MGGQFFFPGQPSPQTAALERRVNAMAGALQSLQQRVYALDAAEQLRQAGRTRTAPIEFRAQYAEDVALWDLFGAKLDGFYIEVGAFDGYNYSVSYAFEAVGWKGLLVEGIPERCEQCRARRKRSRVVHAALSRPGAPPTVEFVVTEDAYGVTEDAYGGMLSHVRGTTGPAAQEAAKMQRRHVSVPVTTMDALLEGHSGPIDFAVIDVEGGEVDLLEGFDLARWKPRVMMIEDNLPDDRSALRPYMATKPYVEAMRMGVNRLYIHADEKELIERAKWLRF